MPSPTLMLAIALAVVTALLGLATKWALNERDAKVRIEAQFATFKAEVRTMGEKAEAAKVAHEASDKLAKDTADAEHKAAIARLTTDISKLRRDRDSARSSFLPASTAATASADYACFDRPAYLGAYGNLVKGLRGLADEGTQATVGLATAQKWATSIAAGARP